MNKEIPFIKAHDSVAQAITGINSQALNNVLRRRQVRLLEAEIREMLIYGSADDQLWNEFQAERDRLMREPVFAPTTTNWWPLAACVVTGIAIGVMLR